MARAMQWRRWEVPAGKVALGIWEGRIAPVCDVSRQAELLTFVAGVVTARGRAEIAAPSAAAKVTCLLDQGVELLVCGAISAPLKRELARRGLQVIPFVAGETEAVLRALLAGRLPDPQFTMPGCRGRRRRLRGGGGAGGGQGRRWGQGWQ